MLCYLVSAHVESRWKNVFILKVLQSFPMHRHDTHIDIEFCSALHRARLKNSKSVANTLAVLPKPRIYSNSVESRGLSNFHNPCVCCKEVTPQVGLCYREMIYTIPSIMVNYIWTRLRSPNRIINWTTNVSRSV